MELYTKHKGRRASINVKEEFRERESVGVCVYWGRGFVHE